MGLGLQAIRDNVQAARSVGVDPTLLKAQVFLLTAFGTGLCGALIFIQITRVTPDAAFSVIDWTAFVIFIVVIGGIGTPARPDRRRRSCSTRCNACWPITARST